MSRVLIKHFGRLCLALSVFFLQPALAADKILIGMTAEFGVPTSTSAQSIERGILLAIDEVNRAGGVLGGRQLELVTRDDRSVTARAQDNLRELAAMPDLVAVFCGKYSPVVEQLLPTLHELKVPLLDPWAAADPIIDNPYQPSYVFRLSLRDTWAVSAMMRNLEARGLNRVGLLVPNTGWGRSSQRAARAYVDAHARMKLVGSEWYNWGDPSLVERYQALRSAGAQAVLLVANEAEGSIVVREIAALPKEQQLPVVSHWGVTGGQFVKLAGPALNQIDFAVVQTFSFVDNASPKTRSVVEAAKKKFGIASAEAIESPVGMAHAYDLTHLLALAIKRAGSTDREAIRRALENLPAYNGLVRRYQPPFTAKRHEALGEEQVFLARFGTDGVLRRIDERKRAR